MTRHEIGVGQLGWHAKERRTDRYGAIRLYHDGNPDHAAVAGPKLAVTGLLGDTGRLVAEVVATRRSGHIGDLYRGIFPSRPDVGELIILGEGKLFVETDEEGCEHVGLRPLDGRDEDWLDPRALYRAHQQTVRLVFEVLRVSPAEIKLRNARAVVVQAYPFFGALLLRQKTVETSAIDTISTDGENLYFNPAFIEEQSAEDLHFIVAHEALHPGLCHHLRRGDRDKDLWNQAADFSMNPILVEAGLTAPASALIRDDLTKIGQAEKIYAKLLSERPPPQPPSPGGGEGRPDGEGGESGGDAGEGPGKGKDGPGDPRLGQARDCGGTGSVIDSPTARDQGQRQAEEAQWKVALAQAAMAAAGTMPGSLQKAVKDLLEPRADWRDLLRRFMDQFARADYSWRSPNRRFVADGLYLPALHSEALPPIAFVIDASGSMPPESLRQALSEVQSIVSQLRPERLDVVVHDTSVRAVRTFEPDEDVEMEVTAGGGTYFSPTCDWIRSQPEEYVCVIWFTDMQPSDWQQAAKVQPDCPVLFVDYGDTKIAPTFGDEVIRFARDAA